MTLYIRSLFAFTIILWLCLGIGAYLRVPALIQAYLIVKQQKH